MPSLSTSDHSRDSAGLTYIYPVMSRRSGGLSVGINFNTNNACNWRCIYCQVPNLQIGAAPVMHFALLESELKAFLASVLAGDFFDRFQITEEQRVIKDIAISGNGEPTTLDTFAEAVDSIGRIATEFGVLPNSRFVLITNGSLIHQSRVRQGLAKLNEYGGEIWFKLDSASTEGRHLINNTAQSFQASFDNMCIAAKLCTTQLQICVFGLDGAGYAESERQALLVALTKIRQNSEIHQVMLYTLARPSLQPEANRLTKLSMTELTALSEQIQMLGFDVSVSG